MARPSDYTISIGDSICEGVAEGKSLSKISKELNIKPRNVFNWFRSNDEFLQNYTRAKEEQAELFAEEIIEIADDNERDRYSDSEDGFTKIDHDVIARSRLRVDARKWVASKLKPKKYGDRITTEDITTKEPVQMIVNLSKTQPKLQKAEPAETQA